jgi:hypothetical protein
MAKTARLSVWCISWSTFDAQGLANLSLCASELSQEFWSLGSRLSETQVERWQGFLEIFGFKAV